MSLANDKQDRRAHQCRHDGCDSAARWQMHVLIECRGSDPRHKLVIEAPSTVQVCDHAAHKRAAMALMASDRNRSAITSALVANGFPAPDWSSVTIVMVPLSALAKPPPDLRVLR
jgi:hypothetical protein